MVTKSTLSYIYMALAVLMISISSFSAKVCLNEHISVVSVVAWRFIFPCLLMVIWFLASRTFPMLTKRGLFLCFLRSCTLVFAQVALFLGMLHLPLSESVLLFATSPIFIALYDTVFGKHRLSIPLAIVFALGAIGVIITLYSSHDTINVYVIAGVFSGILAALSQVIFHKSVQNDKAHFITFYIYFFTAIFSVISLIGYKMVVGHAPQLFYSFSKDGVVFISLLTVGLASLGNQYLRGLAYQMVVNASSLAPFIYLSILMAVIFDIFYFSITPAFHVWVGGTIIIISSLMLLRLKKKNA